MPCALTDNAGYPDYLKSILKEIAAGNDEQLKACACSLKTPTTDEGCPILDEDNKIVAFPFCLADTPPDLSNEAPSIAAQYINIGFTYKQAMQLYWKRKPFKVQYSGNGSRRYSYPPCEGHSSSSGTSPNMTANEFTLKDLVCGISKGVNVNSENHRGASVRSDGGICRYTSLLPYYFGGRFDIFDPYFYPIMYEGEIVFAPFRAWIDKENEKIYAITRTNINLSGCCGVLGPISSSVSSTNIKIYFSSISPGSAGTGTMTIDFS